MHYVKSKDKRTGITYVYESESYWDKEKQQPRAHRKLIGKLDEETGEIIPTDGRGRKRKDRTQQAPDTEPASAQTTASEAVPAALPAEPEEDPARIIREKDAQIRQLTAENEKLRREKAAFLKALNSLAAGYMSAE